MFEIVIIHKPIKNLGLIGSAVLTFILYKQTDKLSIYIDNHKLEPVRKSDDDS